MKRAYGDWRKESLKSWGSELKRFAIKAEQQFEDIPGVNMALLIDAVELLCSGVYDAFAIVSSGGYAPWPSSCVNRVYPCSVLEIKRHRRPFTAPAMSSCF